MKTKWDFCFILSRSRRVFFPLASLDERCQLQNLWHRQSPLRMCRRVNQVKATRRGQFNELDKRKFLYSNPPLAQWQRRQRLSNEREIVKIRDHSYEAIILELNLLPRATNKKVKTSAFGVFLVPSIFFRLAHQANLHKLLSRESRRRRERH